MMMNTKKLKFREDEAGGAFPYTNNISYREGKTSDFLNPEKIIMSPEKMETVRGERTPNQPGNIWKCYEKLLLQVITIASWIAIFVRLIVEMQDNFYRNAIRGVEYGYYDFGREMWEPEWRLYRNGIPKLLIFALIYLCSSQIIRLFPFDSVVLQKVIAAFHVFSGIGFLILLHTSGCIFFIIITLFFYVLTKIFYASEFFALLIWPVSLGILYLNQAYNGYHFASFNKNLEVLDNIRKYCIFEWNTFFYMTMIRIISFSCDYSWAHHKRDYKAINKDHKLKCYDCTVNEPCLSRREEKHLDMKYYNIIDYYSYLLYAPLFIAGPIINYNCFVSQLTEVQEDFRAAEETVKRIVKTLIIYFGYEVYLHCIFSYALLFNPRNEFFLSLFSLVDRYLMIPTMLLVLWGKFYVIWSIGRCVAIMDGMDIRDNVKACFVTFYSSRDFFRMWNHTYHLWIKRYLYFPLGGAKRKFITVWVVFLISGAIYEFSIKRVIWSVGFSFVMCTEWTIRDYLRKISRPLTTLNKYLIGVLSTINTVIFFIFFVIGFGPEISSVPDIIKDLKSKSGVYIIILTLLVLLITNVFSIFTIYMICETQNKIKGFS